MPRKGITLRHLAFTGPAVDTASLEFAPGLNVVYGSSNTGKSSAAKALDFMLGASTWLRSSKENEGYEAGWLGLTLPDGRDVTLYRAVRGGNFRLYDGLLTAPTATPGPVLKAKHAHAASDNLSMFLMDAIGLGVKWAVKSSETGDKNTLSFRNLSPAVIVEEGAIIDERSPILSGQRQDRTLERNVFKILMTGRDDAAVVPVPDREELRTLNRGRVQSYDELIALTDAELGDAAADREGVVRQAEAIQRTLAERTEALRRSQADLDAAVAERRDRSDALDQGQAVLRELTLTIRRYDELDAVYRSDLDRLESLEENSFLLKTLRGRVCPTCGAAPHDQTHGPSAEEIGRFHGAAEAEMRKIRRERAELRAVREGLEAEAAGRSSVLRALTQAIGGLDGAIARLRDEETSARGHYEAYLATSEHVRRILETFARRDQYLALKSQLEARSANRPEKPSLVVGIDGPTAHAFAKVVEEVLREWGFPDVPQVSWDDRTQDIRLDGKERAANGKGVRAVLHAAFKVAMMIFCHRKGLPHPGFVLLDTPLLTYREPMEAPKYGELEEDEASLKATSLNQRFYRHLAGLAPVGQVIVLENTDPPSEIASIAKVTTFTKRSGPGQRYGFFPVAR